ncbi:MAG: secretin and TonB N-terminal domain-containing protein [Aquabacterium sp.]|uniref:secretin and TonB N-terminal domain-containing protein n=1 Tax=Aquabacterium sp. TaxID=1872578 RepID=UPI0025BF2876|nr:secretin and TonB N-terminal domain-containing protein [Aquabacterium sp.]MBI3380395.1 secretin and TonB N-terminal domain-containing protein [Aquabacterium sp.]
MSALTSMRHAGRHFSSQAKFVLAGTLVLLLVGCASYRTFREGQSDIAEGRLADGVIKLKQATELAPDNDEYRRTYLRQRESAFNRLSRQAELDVASGNFDHARDIYSDMLRMQPDDARAQTGLNAVEAARRQGRMLDEASAMAERDDVDAALARTQQVLSENPLNRRASAMLKRLMRNQADATGKELGIYPKLKTTYRTPVSLSFTGASLRQVFEALKLASGLNYLFDKDVQADARVTMSFTDKPVEDVLRLILATNQLSYRILDGDTLLIYPNTSAKSADYRELVIRSFYLSNADVAKTAALIKGIAKAKDVYVDERLNLIVVRDSAEVVRLAEKLVASADMVESEVMLELEVMEVNVNRLQQIGIQWPSAVSATVKGRSGSAGQVGLNEFPLNKGMVTLNLGDPLISAQLRAQNGDSNVLANPRVRVRNRQTAKIMIGDKVPVITVTNTANVGTAESVSYLDVGLKLDIEPTISLDDDVSMKLSLEVSNIIDTITRASGTQTYRLGTRNTSTVLRVRDGETSVLAGLIQKADSRSNTGIPVLNELPLISKLFGNSQDSNSKTEIILLITPHIIRNLDLPGVGLQEYTSGTENAVGAAPIQLGSVRTKVENKVAPVTPNAQAVTPPPAPDQARTDMIDNAPPGPRSRRNALPGDMSPQQPSVRQQ